MKMTFFILLALFIALELIRILDVFMHGDARVQRPLVVLLSNLVQFWMAVVAFIYLLRV